MELGPVRFAELVAPAITRAFVSGMRAAAAAGGAELVESHGREAIGYVIDLRNPLAARRGIAAHALLDVYRYVEPQTVTDTIERSVARGLLRRDEYDELWATDRGIEFLDRLFTNQAHVLGERWSPFVVDRLNPIVGRVVAAAAPTGGAAWAVQHPAHEPPGLSAAVVLLNRLSTMRYHRADAHAAAWRAAGWAAVDVAAMPWGTTWSTERHAIESETNARAAPPFESLSAEERLTLLADLGALG